jgi:hypothetical protein
MRSARTQPEAGVPNHQIGPTIEHPAERSPGDFVLPIDPLSAHVRPEVGSSVDAVLAGLATL